MFGFDVFDKNGTFVRSEFSVDQAHAYEKAVKWMPLGGLVRPHGPQAEVKTAPFPGHHWVVEIALPNGTVSEHALWGDKTQIEAWQFAKDKALKLSGVIASIKQVAGGLGPKYDGPPVPVLGGVVK